MRTILTEAKILSNKITQKNISSFGYRERVQIERLIYLSLKLLLQQRGYDLQGLSNKHRTDILSFAVNNNWPKGYNKIINDCFEFKIYLKNVSSSNAYVRNDTLLKTSTDLESVTQMIATKLLKLITAMQELHTQS